MRYYHDETKRTVYRHPDEPDVSEIRGHQTKRNPHPAQTGWRVSIKVDITCADNYLNHTGHWNEPTFSITSDTYDYPRDSRERAIGWFKSVYLRQFGREIGQDEYEKLHSEYESMARHNTPPSQKK